MPSPVDIYATFPVGGIHKASGYYGQPPNTTPSCLNVWPYQWSSGRARGGVRPGLTATGGAPTGVPYNWCLASWDGGYGLAVTTANGTFVTTDGVTWNERITDAPGATLSSPAVYNNFLLQASTASQFVKQYDLKNGGAITNLTAENDDEGQPKGVAPTYCGLVYTHGGRLVFAADPNNPHVVYMSRLDNHRDYRYTDLEPGSAYISSGETGKINKPIIALLSQGNDCLLLGHIDGISVIVGDMTDGGEIIQCEQQVGPLMQSAWCKTASDATIMMTREGLYAIAAGCSRDVSSQLISEQLPNDLVGINPALGDTCSLCYDGRYHGIHIYVDKASGTDAHYFFDLKSRGFFPMSFAAGTMKLAVNLPGIATSTKSGLIALQSGAAYQFDTASSEEITSHCYYGPLQIGSPQAEGILSEITATLAENASVSESVYGASCRLHFGMSAQEAFNNPSRTVTLDTWDKKGRNFYQHPRGRGVAAYAEVYGTGSNRWCVEEIIGTAYPVAKARAI